MLKVYIGNLIFKNNKKELIDVTDFLESDINVDKTKNNKISGINKISLNFPTASDSYRQDMLDQYEGLESFLNNNKDLSLCPLIVYNNDTLIFNGLAEKTTRSGARGTGYETENIKIDLTLIHKSYELKKVFIAKKLSFAKMNILNYFNSLFNKNKKITKYQNTVIASGGGADPKTASAFALLKSNMSNFK